MSILRPRLATSCCACCSFAATRTCPPNRESPWHCARLCGFSPGEIARGLLTTEGNVQKRIVRAKDILRTQHTTLDPLSTEMIVKHLAAVHLVLYLMFNEGYNSASADSPIRRDVCGEAMRLTMLLAEHPLCATPETHALMALMCLHAARFWRRLDDRGELLLLAEQDRNRWDGELIRSGLEWLDRSAEGDNLSRVSCGSRDLGPALPCHRLCLHQLAAHCFALRPVACHCPLTASPLESSRRDCGMERTIHRTRRTRPIAGSADRRAVLPVAGRSWRAFKSLSQKPRLTVVGWVQPTNAKPWYSVGCTHPTSAASDPLGQTLRRLRRWSEAEQHFAARAQAQQIRRRTTDSCSPLAGMSECKELGVRS